VLGAEHPGTLTTCANLAYWVGKAGDGTTSGWISYRMFVGRGLDASESAVGTVGTAVDATLLVNRRGPGYLEFTMISGLRPVFVSKAPTAQAVLPAADIPPRILSPFPGFGAATCCQPLPVLRATSVSWLPLA